MLAAGLSLSSTVAFINCSIVRVEPTAGSVVGAWLIMSAAVMGMARSSRSCPPWTRNKVAAARYILKVEQ
ncbi:hypothetical protein D3C85_1297570 [compost metagenome]